MTARKRRPLLVRCSRRLRADLRMLAPAYSFAHDATHRFLDERTDGSLYHEVTVLYAAWVHFAFAGDEERVRRLDDFFPRVRLDSKLVLKFIINRDFSQSNRWTKACVLYQIGILKIEDFKLDLIAQLFNPDPLLCEVSAWALYQINKNLYIQNSKRLPDKVKYSLDEMMDTAWQWELKMKNEPVLFA